ncbi:MAG: PAS domain S-box protein [Tissierellales bacterium]|nr:PAS domain S-box protein [Tissierellales bacterium]MBN2828550.1 PAS domain S-box protein [Tissierellales bacterium]
MNFHSVKFKIPAFFAIYLSIMMILSIFLVLDSVERNALEEKISKNLLISELMSKKIGTYISSAMSDVEASANYISIGKKTEAEIYYEINRIFDNYDYFDLVFFMNSEGRMVYSNPYNPVAIEERIYTDRDYYNHVITQETSYVSKLYISRVLNEPHFVLAAPIFEKGELYGLLAAGIPLKEMKRIIKDTDVFFSGGIWVVDRFGSLIVNPYEDLSDKEIVKFNNYDILFDDKKTDIYNILLSGAEGDFIVNRGGEDYYVATTFVEEANLAVMVEQEEGVMLKEALAVVNDLKIIALTIVIAGIILGFILSLGITRPIQRLVYLVRLYGKGELPFKGMQVDSKNEIGELSNTFIEMADYLDKKVEELEKSISRENQIRQYLDNILMNAGSAIVVINSEKKIVIFNRAAEILSGYKGNELIGQHYSILSKKIHFDLYSLTAELDESIKALIEREIAIINIQNRSIPCRIICSVIQESNTNEKGYVFLINNLEVIKKLEQELQREDRLSIVGEFSSSIIHDIGNPLAGLSNLLEIYQNESTNEEEKMEILKLIEDEIRELNSIVLSFLSFIKSRKSEDVQVNICQIVLEATNILRSEMINRDIKLQLDFEEETMYTRIDRRNFKQAIINIIKNSIQAIQSNGIIHISLLWKNDDIIINIQDNGIGIKEDEIGNIFEPFYTTKKDGTGLGLSTAYKTIRDNDGKLEVTSTYKEGSKITITIPGRRSLDECTDHR